MLQTCYIDNPKESKDYLCYINNPKESPTGEVLPVIPTLLKVNNPPIGDDTFTNYKHYQFSSEQVFSSGINEWNIIDEVGADIFKEASGFDVRAFDESGNLLSYDIKSVDISNGRFEIVVSVNESRGKPFVQLIFGNPSALDKSITLGVGTEYSLDKKTLLTKDVETLLVNLPYWFDYNWKNRIPLTIKAGQVPSTQIDFPLLIDSEIPNLIGVSQNELKFAGIERIKAKYQIERFDTITGKIRAWMLKQSISDSTNSYIYRDNEDSVDEQDSDAVWAGFSEVYLLNNNGLNSSPESGRDINLVGNPTPIPDGGYIMNGIDNIMEVTSLGHMTWFDTYSVWIDFELITAGVTGTLWNRDVTASSFRDHEMFITADGILHFRANHTTPTGDYDIPTLAPLSIGVKHSVLINVKSNTERSLYLDGVFQGSVSGGDYSSDLTPGRYGICGAYAGGNAGPRDSFLECKIYGVFIKNAELSADLITTRHNNRNTNSFYDILPKEELKFIEVKN